MFLIAKKAVRLPLEIWLTTQALTVSDISRNWLKLALFSLLLSGLFSLVIVFARTPGIAGWISDPLFARKSLVLHVNFSLVVWFYAFLAVLAISLVKPVKTGQIIAAIKLSVVGVALMVSSILVRDAEPILANYIPVLDHPLFLGGLVLFAAGMCLVFGVSFLSRSYERQGNYPSWHSENAFESIRMASLLVPVAFATILAAWMVTPAGAGRELFFERVMWGGGHILQFANVLGMITVWLIFLRKLTGQELFASKTNKVLLLILVIPAAISPILLLQGTQTQFYYGGFTMLMRWFIFPIVTIYLVSGLVASWRAKKGGCIEGKLLQNVLFSGFLASVLLTIAGFVIGAMIRSSTTLIPAHYHASLGGVTVAYMAMIYLLMNHYGYGLRHGRAGRFLNWQPMLFGVGQLLFAAGFAFAGYHGMGRKMFGTDQSIHTAEMWIGLAGMSLGGLLAVAGGILFTWLVIQSYKRGKVLTRGSQNRQHVV